MKATTMNTVMMDSVQMTAEEIKTAERGLRAKVLAAVNFLFGENKEKPFGLDLSPAMSVRLYL